MEILYVQPHFIMDLFRNEIVGMQSDSCSLQNVRLHLQPTQFRLWQIARKSHSILLSADLDDAYSNSDMFTHSTSE